jgi:cbb3-type cytochrome oxidase subunit 3
MIYIFIVVGAIAGFWVWWYYRRKRRANQNAEDILGFDLPDREPDNVYTTVSGVLEILQAIETGVEQYLRSTAYLNWTRFRQYPEFEVWMLEPTATTSEGYPALTMRSGLKIAGIAIGVQYLILAKPFICVAYNEQYFSYLTDAVRFESQHAVPGHIHPLYPLPDDSLTAHRFNCGGCK